MKTYIEEKIVNINAAKAWEALKCMEQWLPQLRSITKLEYDASDIFSSREGNTMCIRQKV